MRERIPPDYRCRATRSDFWLAYEEVFPRRTHRLCGKGEGETCYVERWNCTLRQRLGRFVRKTLSFSKCDRMHEVAPLPVTVLELPPVDSPETAVKVAIAAEAKTKEMITLKRVLRLLALLLLIGLAIYSSVMIT